MHASDKGVSFRVNVLAAVRLAEPRGATIQEIAEATGLGLDTVNRQLATLRKSRAIHIGSWATQDDQPVCAYVPGAGEDAPCGYVVSAGRQKIIGLSTTLQSVPTVFEVAN
jgi:hypothetical protein